MTATKRQHVIHLKLTTEEHRALIWVAKQRGLDNWPRTKTGAPIVLRTMGIEEAVKLYRERVRTSHDGNSDAGGPGGAAEGDRRV